MQRALAALASAALLAAVLAPRAGAQDYDAYEQRRGDLVSLSAIFGELHHIRRQCEPRYEADVWRERMKALIELEAPQEDARAAMVAGFNQGYAFAQSRFSSCDRRARDYAAARARDGAGVISRLAAPLYEAAENDATAPFVWSDSEGGTVRQPTE